MGGAVIDRATKPPFRLPTMVEAHAVPWNGLCVVSTFTGCGGSELGFRLAGFRTLMACEFIDEARRTFQANFPGVPVDGRDIRQVTAADIMARTGLKRGELDVLEGSPPCASFSTAGKREAGWGKSKKYSDKAQRTDDLFDEYIRLIDGLHPRAFVAENVSGMVKGTAKGYFLDVMRKTKALGYQVRAKVLDAQWLGVPQARQRLIFVGIRDDVGKQPEFPKPLLYRYTLGDVLNGVRSMVHDTGGQPQFSMGELIGKPSCTVTASSQNQFRVTDRVVTSVMHKGGHPNFTRGELLDKPCSTIMASDAGAQFTIMERPLTDAERAETDIQRFAVGKRWAKLKQGERDPEWPKIYRPRVSEPSTTSMASDGHPSISSICHPVEPRKFTIAELRRICSFPEDFQLTGSYAQQWERMGRAVPPLMMRAVALEVAKTLGAKPCAD